jgi:hypothetical protein
MLFEIQKELINGKHTTLSTSIEYDVSQYQKLKKEYQKLSFSLKEKLTEKFKIFLLIFALKYDDKTLVEELLKLNYYEKMSDPMAKVALGRFYASLNYHNRVIKYLLAAFNESDTLTPSDLSALFSSLFFEAWLKDCRRVIKYVLENYPGEFNWKLIILRYDVDMVHYYPENIDSINQRLTNLLPQCDKSIEYFTMAGIFSGLGYFNDMVNMYDAALQRLIPTPSQNTKKAEFSSSMCLDSMNEIIDVLESDNIQAFPIAGSLLGLVRDGKIMDYDKDADIGIFITGGHQQIFDIVSLLCKDPKFRCPNMLNASPKKHIWNVAIYDSEKGMAVDLFFFYRREAHAEFGVYTPCGTLRWIFSPFELTRQTLIGREYWLPQHPEKHLEEMYGDNWREPIEVWDSLLNCPNLSKDSQAVSISFGLPRLYKALTENKLKKAINYYETLTKRWGMHFSPETDAHINKLISENAQ